MVHSATQVLEWLDTIFTKSTIFWEIEKLHEVFCFFVIGSKARRDTRDLVQILIHAISVVK